MDSEAPDPTSFQILTSHLPERERIALWREIVAQQSMRIESEPLPGVEFRVDVKGRALPGLMIARASLSGMRDRRTAHLIADGVDEITLFINLAGPVLVTARGSEMALAVGDAVLFASTEESVVTRPAPGTIIGLSLPREVLTPLIPNLHDRLAQIIPAESEALRLLKGYLSILLDEPPPTTPELRQAVLSHVAELIALALGATSVANGRGVTVARLRAIKSDIFENLGDRELTLAVIAQRHKMSERNVQLLFEGDQTTFSEFLLERRLERVHRALADPRFVGHTISALAYEFGFGDLSYFNRCFRRRYGLTPSERRARAVASLQK